MANCNRSNNNNNAEYEKAAKDTPLTLFCSIDIFQIPKCKVYRVQGNQTRKVELPVNTMEKLEAILYCISEFESFRDGFNLNGQHSFQFYWETLSGVARNSWDLACDGFENAQQQTDANFFIACTRLLHTFYHH